MAFRTLGWAAAIAMALASAAAAQDSKPSALQQAMKFAPPAASGMLHVEIDGAAITDALTKVVTPLEANTLMPAFKKVVAGVQAVDLFLTLQGEPVPLVVLHGKLAPADINDLITSSQGTDDDKLVPAGNGRYSPKKSRAPILLIVGGEANDVPAGVTLAGVAPAMEPNAIAALGTGNELLAKLLGKTDTKASAFFAIDLSSMPFGGPSNVIGSVALFNKGKSQITANFIDAETAAEFMKEEGKEVESATKDYASLKLDGKQVTLATATEEPVLPRLVEAVIRARASARKAMSAVNLSSIGKAIVMYQAEHGDKAPADFLDLVKDGQSPAIFISPASGRKPSMDAAKTGKLESDYIYIRYKNLSDADAGLVLAYEDPQYTDGKGVHVLFVDTHVGWVEMDEFKKLLDKSKKHQAEEK